MLTLGKFFIYFALKPNLKAISVSDPSIKEGETLIIKLVIEFPPRLYCKSLVSFESLYGI